MESLKQRKILEEKIERYQRWASNDLATAGTVSDRTLLKLTGSVPYIQRAISAINAGTYGTCIDCGEQIPEARLHAVPGACRCVECQESFDEKR